MRPKSKANATCLFIILLSLVAYEPNAIDVITLINAFCETLLWLN